MFDHATKRYPGRAAPAVDDLTLSIPAGEVCCLVGPSGGGKTTAMKLVNRLVELTSGDVRVDGRSVSSLDETELRRGIGYVIQQVGLFPHMTVAENVATVPRRSAGRRPKRPAVSTSCSTWSTCQPAITAPGMPRNSPVASASASALPVLSRPTRP